MEEISIKSLADAHRYREELCARKPEQDPTLARWRVCERCVLLLILAAFALIYLLIAVNVEVLSLPELIVSVRTSK